MVGWWGLVENESEEFLQRALSRHVAEAGGVHQKGDDDHQKLRHRSVLSKSEK